MSTNIFVLEDGHPTPSTNIAILEHMLRELGLTGNMVPVFSNQSLLVGGKFLEAGCFSVCYGEEVNIYYGHTTKITV